MTNRYVFLAEFADEVKAFKPEIETLKNKGSASSLLAVACWPNALAAFETIGIPTANTIPFLPERSHERVFLAAADFAWGWYNGLEVDLCYEGQSLPESIVYPVSQVFAHLFLNIELLKNIIISERPEKLVLKASPAPIIDSVLIGNRERYMAVLANSVAKQIPVDVTLVPYSRMEGGSEESGRSITQWWGHLKKRQRAARRLLRRPGQLLGRRYLLALPGAAATFRQNIVSRYAGSEKRLVFWEGLPMRRRLYDRLRPDRSYGVVGLTAFGPAPWIAQSPLPSLWTGEFTTPEIEIKVQTARRNLVDTWNTLSSDATFTARFRYEGVDFWPAIKPRLEFFFTRHFPDCIRQYECIREFVRRFDPHLLVTGHIAGQHMAWAHKAFQDSGKPTLALPEGYDLSGTGARQSRARLLHGLKATFWPLYASKLAARGVASKEWYEENGVAPGRVDVTGVPDWGDGAPLPVRTRDHRRRRLGISPEKRMVLYTGSFSERTGVRAYSEETTFEILETTRDIVEEVGTIPDCCLVIKPRPGTSYEDWFFRLARPFPKVRVLSADVDFRDLVPLCDVLIAPMASSTAVEALLHDKDVIVYNPTGRESVLSPLCMGIDDPEVNYMVGISDRQSLVPALNRLRTDGALRRRLAEKRSNVDPMLLHNRDGKSLERVLEVIRQQLAEPAIKPNT